MVRSKSLITDNFLGNWRVRLQAAFRDCSVPLWSAGQHNGNGQDRLIPILAKDGKVKSNLLEQMIFWFFPPKIILVGGVEVIVKNGCLRSTTTKCLPNDAGTD